MSADITEIKDIFLAKVLVLYAACVAACDEKSNPQITETQRNLLIEAGNTLSKELKDYGHQSVQLMIENNQTLSNEGFQEALDFASAINTVKELLIT